MPFITSRWNLTVKKVHAMMAEVLKQLGNQPAWCGLPSMAAKIVNL
jgi:hypothetical protein